ncbi:MULTISPECIES: hypothetical protein [unclassified Paenibacillus]|uniref:hypothetical protein n=1 Tax=unclassified Paenibacillus TaxID=185978 RepID=UPI0024063107|nr:MULTISPECIES: hypothetical protein [unclassified Paenibacillus]MDF9845099.1 hypothetical protein [Paenibacillus sp. PastF-2]MDF9851670.1 hypothetical protein [Paenibacillus sp. PastM-2]MDF9858254.1 hypothetical protein [Paenibacillus sp. PastF-1]MDH6483518.1 hypothetical protein [Paenibacillus sp. PastH-2]MDH6510958.1 hypothetical protein [Paenibacillus sp. PastM-3]
MRGNAAVRTLLLNGFIMVLMLLAGCNSGALHQTYTFSGEGEHWSAIYSETVTEKPVISEGKATYYQPSRDYNFQLAYKGEAKALKEIKQFTYGFEALGHGSSQSMEGPVRMESLHMYGSSGGSLNRGQSVITVSVEWDGQKEQFELQTDGDEAE